MKSGKEWEAWYWAQDFETGEGVMARFAEAVQADALESSKIAIVAALQGDYYLEQAEHVVSETIDKLKERR